MEKPSPKEIILQNIPNLLTVSRIILTFVVMYMIFVGENVIVIISTFAIAALTDWFDGRLARRFKWESEFGRKADVIADRFLWVGTALAFVISFGEKGLLNGFEGWELFLIMSREIITIPFAMIAFLSGNHLPETRFIGKLTTFLQGFALPALIISIDYPIFVYLSIVLSAVTGVVGFLSALYYIYDTQNPKKQKKRK